MPILRINAVGTMARLAATDGPYADVAHALRAHTGKGPVLIMLHGYRYSPSQHRNSPHVSLLAAGQPGADAGWPRRMGFGTGTAGKGLCIAFGWEAGGTIWRANREAGLAGATLADLIRMLHANGKRPVNIMAHSLGARVALAALPQLQAGMINRMILLTGAEFRSTAEAALASPAGRSAEVLNITSRENDVFDFLYEWLLAPLRVGARTVGAGLALSHCVTAQIDHPAHLAGLAALGFPTAAANRRMCHWSAYLRPGLFALYRAFLDADHRLSLAQLRAALPESPEPRWSRLFPAPAPDAPQAT